MPDEIRIQKIVNLLKQRGFSDKSTCILSPDYVQRIIRVTNQGKVDKASAMLRDAEQAIKPVWDALTTEDQRWYHDLVTEIYRAIKSADRNLEKK
jgi:hypothetical protein